MGIGNARVEGKNYKEKYSSKEAVAKEFQAIQDYWQKRMSNYRCETPSWEVNTMVNIWNQYQCHMTFNWSRSASFNEAGGRDGIGYRDTNQDTLGVVHAIPEEVKQKLINLLKAQLSEGYAIHNFQPLVLQQGEHNVVPREGIFLMTTSGFYCLLEPIYGKLETWVFLKKWCLMPIKGGYCI